MRVSLASFLFACTLMASAGAARAGEDGGADAGTGGSGTGGGVASTTGTGGAGGGPIGIQPTTTPDNLGCSAAPGGAGAPAPVLALVIAGVALALARRGQREESVR